MESLAPPATSDTSALNGSNHGPPAKKFKSTPEDPTSYSHAVRRRYASASRTGQACDRCKERKMKCDPNPLGCLNCRQKKFSCLTTDRVTQRASERGQPERLEQELEVVREQLALYRSRYGDLDMSASSHNGVSGNETIKSAGRPGSYHWTHVKHEEPSPRFDQRHLPKPSHVDSDFVYEGPVSGTIVDIIGAKVDIAGYENAEMEVYDKDHQGVFNASRTSVLNTIHGAQRISDPQLPSKEETVQTVKFFFLHIWHYTPVVHQSSFLKTVDKYFDNPKSITRAQEVQIVVMLAIIADQMAVRNPTPDKASKQSNQFRLRANRWLHYGLSLYNDLMHDQSLESMQALTMFLILFRNLPKPGYSWNFSNKVLVRAIDLNYHRHPDRIALPPDENNPLAKELRVRVWWIILTFCITTGARLGRPVPWHFQRFDVPLPKTIKDEELSSSKPLTAYSGKCDYLACIHLCKLLPLLNDVYNNVLSVRPPPHEYIQTVEQLDNAITAWRDEWETTVETDECPDRKMNTTFLMDSWAAEYRLTLHHPNLFTAISAEQYDRNLDICHQASRKLLLAFMSAFKKYNGADLTWHSVGVYALALGVVLHSFDRKKTSLSGDQIKASRDELGQWIFLIEAVDLLLKSNGYLTRIFQPRIQSIDAGIKRSVTPMANDGDSYSHGNQRHYSQGGFVLEPQAVSQNLNHNSQHNPMAYDYYAQEQQSVSSAYSQIHPPMALPDHPPLFPQPLQNHAYSAPPQSSYSSPYASPLPSLSRIDTHTSNNPIHPPMLPISQDDSTHTPNPATQPYYPYLAGPGPSSNPVHPTIPYAPHTQVSNVARYPNDIPYHYTPNSLPWDERVQPPPWPSYPPAAYNF